MSLELVLTPLGTCELRRNQDHVLWSSIQDSDFQEEFGETITTDDLPEILDYLVDKGDLTDAQADKVECIEETNENEDEDEDEDED